MEKMIAVEKFIEAVIIFVAPIAGLIAIIADFSWTNLLLFSILLLIWKHINGAVR